MKHGDYKEGFCIVDHDGLKVRTVCETRRGAIVNWLVTDAHRFVSSSHTEEHINAMWDAHRGDAMVMPVRIYVQ